MSAIDLRKTVGVEIRHSSEKGGDENDDQPVLRYELLDGPDVLDGDDIGVARCQVFRNGRKYTTLVNRIGLSLEGLIIDLTI